MTPEELDKALYESMNLLWKTYRSNPEGLRDTLRDIHTKYPDATISDFSTHFCFGLLGAIRRKELSEVIHNLED